MKDYILASHNSMSYLPPRKWYMKPFAFMARCQSKSIQEQYEKYGVRLFDLRVRFNKDGEIYFAHGIVEYKCDCIGILHVLDYLDTKNAPVRIMLENKDGSHEEEFKEWCKYFEESYPNIKFFGGRNKWTWKQIYKFKNSEFDIENKYSSCNYNNSTTGSIWDDWFPWLYAYKNNKINRKKGTYRDYLMIDFVEI